MARQLTEFLQERRSVLGRVGLVHCLQHFLFGVLTDVRCSDSVEGQEGSRPGDVFCCQHLFGFILRCPRAPGSLMVAVRPFSQEARSSPWWGILRQCAGWQGRRGSVRGQPSRWVTSSWPAQTHMHGTWQRSCTLGHTVPCAPHHVQPRGPAGSC